MKSSDNLDDPVKTPCEVLIYQSYAAPLILNTYVLPNPSTVKKDIEEEWKKRGAIYIKKPPPKGSFWINSNFKLSTNCPSEINPVNISLTNRIAPEYFEVCIKKPDDEFEMELKVAEETSIWKAAIRKGPDYRTAMPTHSADQGGAESRPRDKGAGSRSSSAAPVKATVKVEKKRIQLIERIGEAILGSLLDGLHHRHVITRRERNHVLQENSVTENQVTSLVDMVWKKGEKACKKFLSLLRRYDPNLYEDLGLQTSPVGRRGWNGPKYPSTARCGT